jgi:formylglycine-generating enzyme required for sulfatase activity
MRPPTPATPGWGCRGNYTTSGDASDESTRLLRGGSWISFPGFCRSAYRNGSHPDNQLNDVGFRVCCLPQG